MTHHYRFLLSLFLVGFADSATMPSSAGCDYEFDEKECVIRMYCYNEVSYNEYLKFTDRRYDYYDDKFENFLSVCNDGSEYTKIALVYKYDDRCEENIPVFVSQSLPDGIYSLYLINKNCDLTPNLSEMKRLQYLNWSHSDITIAELSNNVNIPSLAEINYSYNNISDFDMTGRFKFENLERLTISHNKIKFLPDEVFYGLSKLNNLDLSYNSIEVLNIETFDGIKELLYLNLSHNNIIDINNSMYRFKNLKHLNLSHNNIQTVSNQSFINLQNLEILDLSFNSISSIEATTLSGMPLLKGIHLKHNALELVDKDMFQNNNHLSHVDLSCNNISTIQKEMFKDKTILSFSIEDNQLEGPLVKGNFTGLTLITYLNFKSQKITSVNDFAFYGLENLSKLILSYNQIDKLTSKSFRLVLNLTYLDLSYNRITDIDFEKDDLANLKHLLLENNYLIQIKHDVFNDLTLNVLTLAHNNISQLESKAFENQHNLLSLEMSYNPLIGSIQEDMYNGLNSLEKLEISYTKVTEITNNSFEGIFQLKYFNASHGSIHEIGFNAFMNTGQLISMDLSYNKLTTFLLNFDHLMYLTVLKLSNNLLTEIMDTTFKGLYKLEVVELSSNVIEQISNESFTDQNNLRKLDLSYNNELQFYVSIIKRNKNLNDLLVSGLKDVIIPDDEYLPLKLILLSENKINNINALNLKSFYQLEHLVLKFNDIPSLKIGNFYGTKSIRSLDLSFNKITSIQPNVFENNNLLKVLNISHNMLSELNYGIFQGLLNLKILDLSYNHIEDLKSERFYEFQNLYELVVDGNNINYIDVLEFNALGILSIGENPLPCDVLIKLNKTGSPFKLTAINIIKNKENFHGITCSVNKKSVTKNNSNNFDFKKFTKNDEVLIEIRDELVKIANARKSEDGIIGGNDNNFKNVSITPYININEYIQQLIAQQRNMSGVMVKETNITNNLLKNILKTMNDYRKTTTEIILPHANKENNATIDNIVPYVYNKLKQEFEEVIASKEQKNKEDIDSKFKMLKAQIVNDTIQTNVPTSKSSQQVDSKSGNLYTEICVSLILVIFVCYILYKIYTSKINTGAQRSPSTRELEFNNL